MTKITRRAALASGAALAASRVLPARAADMEIRFYYPIAVSGPITKIIDGYGADFEKENPGVKIKPIYAGDYVQTIGKALIYMSFLDWDRIDAAWEAVHRLAAKHELGFFDVSSDLAEAWLPDRKGGLRVAHSD